MVEQRWVQTKEVGSERSQIQVKIPEQQQLLGNMCQAVVIHRQFNNRMLLFTNFLLNKANLKDNA